MTHVSRWLCAMAFGALSCAPLLAQHRESFESPDRSWRLGPSDCARRVLTHRRTFDDFHSGSGCELLQFHCGHQGMDNLFVHAIDPARVIEELQPSVWIKATRPGIELRARLVLPRSAHPETGAPLTAFIKGGVYGTVGAWQQLRIEDPLAQVKQQVFFLRLAFPGTEVEPEEAYIDLIMLNALPGRGVTKLWIDDLELAGFAPVKAADGPVAGAATRVPGEPVASAGVTGGRSFDSPADIRLQGSVLSVGGRPFFARIIEHNGEPLATLKRLGFNTVKLRAPPTPAQLEEARQLDIWLVSPPPPQAAPAAASRVLAWLVGDGSTEQDLPAVRSRANAVRRQMGTLPRPLVCDVRGAQDQYAFFTDVLLFGTEPIGTSLQLQDLTHWINQRRQLSGRDSACWVSIQTEVSHAHYDQLLGLNRGEGAAPALEPEQIWLQAYHALAAGARGLCFRSRTRLDGTGEANQIRAAALRALNSDLKIFEPWTAVGVPGRPLPMADRHVRVHSLKTERSQLLWLVRAAADQQFSLRPHDDRVPIAFSVHGLPTMGRAYQVEAGELTPISNGLDRRTEIHINQPGFITFVVLTQDPLVVHHLGRSVGTQRSEIAQARIQLAELQFERTDRVIRQLGKHDRVLPPSRSVLQAAEFMIEKAKALQNTGDTAHAFRFADRVLNRMRELRYRHWYRAAAAYPSGVSSPLCLSFDSLSAHWDLVDRMRAGQWSEDLLGSGRFEHPEARLAAGWSRHDNGRPAVESTVDFRVARPYSGRRALRLAAEARGAGAAVGVAGWPVSVSSAPVEVRAGDVYRVQGWVHVPRAIRGTSEGLLIFDSLSGIPLAERVYQTSGWRKFTLYRVAPQSGQLRVIFALTGLGEARLDDVSVCLLGGPDAAQLVGP